MRRIDCHHDLLSEKGKRDLASSIMEEKKGILIVGPYWTGKSHIAQTLGGCTVLAGFEGLFTTVFEILLQMHTEQANNAFEPSLADLSNEDLLVIDDFGLKS